MLLSDIIEKLEKFAPPSLQEDYDNAGLITGNASWECTGALISLDTTEDILDEAIENKCNLIVSHHPLVFRGLKKFTGNSYVERAIIKAIKNDVALYAIHTNLDNILQGVNGKIADKLGLQKRQVIQPREAQLKKLITFAPIDKAEEIRVALFKAGAGDLGKYSECSFNTEGTGTFKAGEDADPFVGEKGKRHEEKEIKIEVIFPGYLQQNIVAAMIEAHPYEEVAHDIFSLGNHLSDVGSGLTGHLNKEISEEAFLAQVLKTFNLQVIKHTRLRGKPVKKIALCGGAGIFLLKNAIQAGADVFITSDIKYHDYFEADGKILLLDIGHFESEQFTTDLLFDHLRQNFPTFAVLKTGISTNPVHYFSS